MGANTSPPEIQEILDAVRRIVRALRESSRSAERTVGLSAAQLFVLHKLAEAPAMSVNDLATRTHTHQSSVSTVVTRLVRGGLVRRQRAANDGRTVQLRLTARGRRLLRHAPNVAQERLVRGIECLTPARRRQLSSSLTALAYAMDAVDRTPTMFFEDRTVSSRPKRHGGTDA